MTKLTYENEFCIYQEKGLCVLKSVQLDIQGNCLDCIYVNIEKNTLSNLKDKQLRNLHDLRQSQ